MSKAQILIHRYFDAAWKQGRKGIGYSDTQLPEHKELILYVFDLEHRLAVAEAKNQTYEEHIDELGDRSDTCVYSVINRVRSFCQCKRKGGER